MKQRIIVLNCFALSRIFYTASVLPITKSAVAAINTIVGGFIWKNSGKVLRIAREEIINREEKGGLALLDTESMCNSLITSQTFRIMKSSDLKSQKHLNFWMSDFLEDIWQGPGQYVVSGNIESDHFNSVAGCVSKVRLLANLDISLWRMLTNKSIYLAFSDQFSKPKIERESSWDMTRVWRRLRLNRSSTYVHESSFLLIHNKLPIQERLFRIRLAPDPYCQYCPGAEIQDIKHYFVTCERVKSYWRWIKKLCLALLGLIDIDDEILLKFYWPRSVNDREISWLVGQFTFIVWEMLFKRKLPAICGREFFGFMKFRYREALGANAISRIGGLL